MVTWIFTIVFYVFFVYGIIAFVQTLYFDVLNRYGLDKTKKISVLIDSEEDVEYYVRVLKKDFSHIVLIMEEENQEAREIADSLSKDMNIEYRVLYDIRRVEKS